MVKVVVKVRVKVRAKNRLWYATQNPNPSNQTIENGSCPEQYHKKYAGRNLDNIYADSASMIEQQFLYPLLAYMIRHDCDTL